MKRFNDVAYRTNQSLPMSERCTADIYIPESASTGDCVLWLHGGGITQGDKGGPTPPLCLPDDVALVSMNYRLLHHAPFPACIEDAAAALAWLRPALAEKGFQVKRLYIAGESAGAYIAAMVMADPRWLAIHSVDPVKIDGAFLLSGQMTTHFAVKALMGLGTQPIIDEHAPLWYVRESLPPICCVVGSEDIPARLEENQLLAASLKAVGHTQHVVHVIEGRNHGTVGNGLHQSDDEVTKILHKFLK